MKKKLLEIVLIYLSCAICIQYFDVFLLSLIIANVYENPTLKNISFEWFEILYTGILSAGLGYTLQIIAQHKASPAPAAIILSMEGVTFTKLRSIWGKIPKASRKEEEQIEISAHYSGYLEKQEADIIAFRKDENLLIPKEGKATPIQQNLDTSKIYETFNLKFS